MVNYRLQTTFITTDNVAANFSTNTLHFSAVDETDLPDIETSVKAMYDAIRPYFSSLFPQNGHRWKWYDLADPTPRAPVRETTWNFTAAPTGNPLAPETALCISFQADKVSGESQARRRNRIYLGPLQQGINDTTGRPTAASVSAIRNAGQGLLTASVAAADWTWGIYSTLSLGLAPVTNGWVDNEYDTQRRRGRVATSRSTFT